MNMDMDTKTQEPSLENISEKINDAKNDLAHLLVKISSGSTQEFKIVIDIYNDLGAILRNMQQLLKK